jgi:hypothetical protein
MVFALAIVILVLFFANERFPVQVKKNLKGTPEPILHGKETYRISSGQPGPKFTEASFEPLDPKKGEHQVMLFHVLHRAPIDAVSARAVLDNGTYNIPLTRIEGTDADGVWKGEWNMPDTYETTYVVTLTAKAQDGTSKVDITIR